MAAKLVQLCELHALPRPKRRNAGFREGDLFFSAADIGAIS
jgi:hypothetical protein